MNKEDRIEDDLLNGRPMELDAPGTVANTMIPLGALPPTGALPPADIPPPQGNLMTAIRNGIQEMGRSQPVAQPTTGRPRGITAQMVNLLSDSDSSDEEIVHEAGNSIAPNAQYRQAEQAQTKKEEQSSLRRELLDGVSPGKFGKGIQILHEIKSQAQKDSAAYAFIQKVVRVAEKLEKINVALGNEQCPVKTFINL